MDSLFFEVDCWDDIGAELKRGGFGLVKVVSAENEHYKTEYHLVRDFHELESVRRYAFHGVRSFFRTRHGSRVG